MLSSLSASTVGLCWVSYSVAAERSGLMDGFVFEFLIPSACEFKNYYDASICILTV